MGAAVEPGGEALAGLRRQAGGSDAAGLEAELGGSLAQLRLEAQKSRSA
jgi:hypothetical protein